MAKLTKAVKERQEPFELGGRLVSFSAPFPGEVLYSTAARFQLTHSVFASHKKTIRYLFGSNPTQVNVVLPHGIAQFASVLPESLGIEIDSLLYLHTLLPLLKLFLPPKRLGEIRHAILEGRNVSLNALGYGRLGHSAIESPRMCWRCFEEDIASFGQPYWHRLHQAPGVHLCDRHGIVLLDGCSICGPFRATEGRLILPYIHCKCGRDLREDATQLVFDDVKIKDAENFVAFTRGLLDQNLPDVFADHRVAFLRTELQQRGWMNTIGADYHALTTVFLGRFSPNFLSGMGIKANLGESKEAAVERWLRNMLVRHYRATWPAWHIMVLMGIFGNFNSLMSRWNQFADNLRNSCGATRTQNNSEPPLELILRDLAPHLLNRKIFLRDLVYKFPTAFRQIWSSGVLPEATCKTCSPSLNTPSDSQIYEKSSTSKGDQRSPVFRQQKASNLFTTLDPRVQHRLLGLKRWVGKHRDTLLRVIKEQPNISHSKLKSSHPAAYCYLRTLEPDWYATHIEKRLIPSRPVRRPFNFAKRDSEVKEAIDLAVKRILARPGLPIRLTFSLLCREAGVLGKLNGKLSGLPNTQKLLSNVVETPEETSHRRLNWAAAELQKSREPLTASRLRHKAKLGRQYDHLITDFMRSAARGDAGPNRTIAYKDPNVTY